MNLSRPSARHAALVAGALLAACGTLRAQCDVTQIAASDRRSDDNFGVAMAISETPLGSRLMVGAPHADYSAQLFNSGKAYVYSITGNQIIQEGQFHPNFGEYHESDLFGASIGFSYPYAVVGAWRASNPHVNFGPGGGVFFFKEISGIWSQVDSFYNPQADAAFGRSAAMNADWAIVGAPLYDVAEALAPPSVDSGMASFYRRVNNHWVPDAVIVEHDDFNGTAGQKLGDSVAIFDDVAVIGVPNGHDYQNGAGNAAGFIKVLRRDANNQWADDGAFRYFASDPGVGDQFGASVATNSYYVVVGAPNNDVNGAPDAGAAYVFTYVNNAWAFQQKLVASEVTTGARFGSSVSIYAGRILVGAPGTNPNDAHKAYVFVAQAGGHWGQEAVFVSPDAAPENFGAAVVTDGYNFIVADDQADSPNMNDNGEAYSFHAGGAGDACDGAISLFIGSAQQNIFTGCTGNATPSFPPLSCGGFGAGNDVWYSWVAPCSGNMVIDTFGSDFDTILSVHDDCPELGDDHVIACNDDAFPVPNRASLVSFNYSAGQRCLIRITGYGGASGNYTLRANDFAPAPANNSCANPQTVTPGAHLFTTCAATLDQGVPTPPCAPIHKDVWFRYTAPTSGILQLDTCDATMDSVLVVYPGGVCPDANSIAAACNDDAPAGPTCTPLSSSLTLPVTGGFQYMIRVGAFPWTPAYGGEGMLDVTFFPHLSNCPCDFDNSGSINSQDFFSFLVVFFELDARADFNLDGTVNSQDLFDFLTCFFNPPIGCN